MANWHDLSTELKLIVLNYLVDESIGTHHLHYRSAYAAVSREWQWFFEKINFKQLTIQQSDLLDFEKILNTTRIISISILSLQIELPEYTCDSCNSKENIYEACKNNRIIITALWDFFTILSAWEYNRKGGLCLTLGIYSPSDEKHHFRSHRSENGAHSTCIKYHDPAHGWYVNRQIAPGLGAKLRLLGTPLKFDIHRFALLPKLDFVTELYIPRKFFRTLPDLPVIIRALPKLQVLRYEIWRSLTQYRKNNFMKSLHNLREALPPTLQKLAIFEETNDALHSSTKGYTTLLPPSDWQFTSKLTELSVSFLCDARAFFHAYDLKSRSGRIKEGLWWGNLRALTLTSYQLILNKNPQEVDKLLCEAAEAALRMPKLRILQLWYRYRREACVFRYKNTQHEGITSIAWYNTKEQHTIPILSNSVMQAWQAVTERYGKGCLSVESGRILEEIRSYGSVLRYLQEHEHILLPESAKDMIWEAKHVKTVRFRPPPSRS